MDFTAAELTNEDASKNASYLTIACFKNLKVIAHTIFE